MQSQQTMNGPLRYRTRGLYDILLFSFILDVCAAVPCVSLAPGTTNLGICTITSDMEFAEVTVTGMVTVTGGPWRIFAKRLLIGGAGGFRAYMSAPVSNRLTGEGWVSANISRVYTPVSGKAGPGGSHGGCGDPGGSGEVCDVHNEDAASAFHPYGVVRSPLSPGSSGVPAVCTTSFYSGGAAGGVVHLVVGDYLSINGTISANGISPTNQCISSKWSVPLVGSGGGSGGSVFINATTAELGPSTGLITANGAEGSTPINTGNTSLVLRGGGGGGGRISLLYDVDNFASASWADWTLGLTATGMDKAAPGTIYIESTRRDPTMIIKGNGNAQALPIALTPFLAGTTKVNDPHYTELRLLNAATAAVHAQQFSRQPGLLVGGLTGDASATLALRENQNLQVQGGVLEVQGPGGVNRTGIHRLLIGSGGTVLVLNHLVATQGGIIQGANSVALTVSGDLSISTAANITLADTGAVSVDGTVTLTSQGIFGLGANSSLVTSSGSLMCTDSVIQLGSSDDISINADFYLDQCSVHAADSLDLVADSIVFKRSVMFAGAFASLTSRNVFSLKQSNISLTWKSAIVSRVFRVATDSVINATALGHSSSVTRPLGDAWTSTLGDSFVSVSSASSPGGSHGGCGGPGGELLTCDTSGLSTTSMWHVYGSMAAPTTLGSSGAPAYCRGGWRPGGRGGGALYIEVSEAMSINGTLAADGGEGSSCSGGETGPWNGAGGGSGGSIFINSPNAVFLASTGELSVIGGLGGMVMTPTGAGMPGGIGGGGRIAVRCLYHMDASVAPGLSPPSYSLGGGTFFSECLLMPSSPVPSLSATPSTSLSVTPTRTTTASSSLFSWATSSPALPASPEASATVSSSKTQASTTLSPSVTLSSSTSRSPAASSMSTISPSPVVISMSSTSPSPAASSVGSPSLNPAASSVGSPSSSPAASSMSSPSLSPAASSVGSPSLSSTITMTMSGASPSSTLEGTVTHINNTFVVWNACGAPVMTNASSCVSFNRFIGNSSESSQWTCSAPAARNGLMPNGTKCALNCVDSLQLAFSAYLCDDTGSWVSGAVGGVPANTSPANLISQVGASWESFSITPYCDADEPVFLQLQPRCLRLKIKPPQLLSVSNCPAGIVRTSFYREQVQDENLISFLNAVVRWEPADSRLLDTISVLKTIVLSTASVSYSIVAVSAQYSQSFPYGDIIASVNSAIKEKMKFVGLCEIPDLCYAQSGIISTAPVSDAGTAPLAHIAFASTSGLPSNSTVFLVSHSPYALPSVSGPISSSDAIFACGIPHVDNVLVQRRTLVSPGLHTAGFLVEVPLISPSTLSYTITTSSSSDLIEIQPALVFLNPTNATFWNQFQINPIARVPFFVSARHGRTHRPQYAELSSVVVQVDVAPYTASNPSQARRMQGAGEDVLSTYNFILPVAVVPAIVPLADDLVMETGNIARSFWSTETFVRPADVDSPLAIAAWMRSISRPVPTDRIDELFMVLTKETNVTFIIHPDADSMAYTRAFPENSRVTANRIPCRVNWIIDGTAMHVTLPSFSSICSGEISSCTVNMTIDTQIDNAFVLSVLLRDQSPKIEGAALGFSLECPGYCPGRMDLPVLPTASDIVGGKYNNDSVNLVRSHPTLLQFDSLVNAPSFLTYTQTCASNDSFLDQTIFLGICLNASDPLSRLCPFGTGSRCTACPTGVLCLGDYRVIATEGYWTPSGEGIGGDIHIVKCAYPSLDRCPGYNFSRGVPAWTRQECGLGYDGFACSLCAKGYYVLSDLAMGVCSPCPKSNLFQEIMVPVLIIIGAFLGLGGVILGLTVVITRRYGGTVSGAFQRSVTFVLASLSILQLAAQANETLRKLPNLSPTVSMVSSAASVMNFAVGTTPAACYSSDPFITEIVVFSIFIALCLVLLALYLVPCADPGFEQRDHMIRKSSRHFSSNCIIRFLRIVAVVRKIAVAVMFAGYGPVSNFVFKSFSCETKSVTILGYLQMQQDGTTLTRLGFDGFRSINPETSVSADEHLATVITVEVSKSHPSAVCKESSHKTVLILSLCVFLLYIVAAPASLCVYSIRRVRRRRVVLRQVQGIRDAMSVKNTSVSRRVCGAGIGRARTPDILDSDEASTLDAKLSPLVDSVYRPSKFVFRFMDVFVLIALGAVSYLWVLNTGKASVASVVVTAVIMVIPLSLALWWGPYRSEASFLLPVRVCSVVLSIVLSAMPLVPSFASSDRGGILLFALVTVFVVVLLGAFFLSLRRGAQEEEKIMLVEEELVDTLTSLRKTTRNPLELRVQLRALLEGTKGAAPLLAGTQARLEQVAKRKRLSDDNIQWLRVTLGIMNEPLLALEQMSSDDSSLSASQGYQTNPLTRSVPEHGNSGGMSRVSRVINGFVHDKLFGKGAPRLLVNAVADGDESAVGGIVAFGAGRERIDKQSKAFSHVSSRAAIDDRIQFSRAAPRRERTGSRKPQSIHRLSDLDRTGSARSKE